MSVVAGIVTGYGINAEFELAQAFSDAGAVAQLIHVQDLIENPRQMDSFQIVSFPGGFAFGDHLGSGKVLSHLLSKHLDKDFGRFLDDGKLILGICNGFQMITRMGLVPNLSGSRQQEATLLHNQSGNFIDRWVELEVQTLNKSPWLTGLTRFRAPIRHGEGRYALKDQTIEDAVESGGQIAITYSGDNPNGSWKSVAGLTDKTGQVLGMMPHPEAARTPDQDPAFRSGLDSRDGSAPATTIFANAVRYCRSQL